MITSVHTLIYSDDADATRAFFRDLLAYPCIDAGDGWLIFALPPAELGVHPTDHGQIGAGTMKLSLMCDDLEATLAELRDKGAEVMAEPFDAGYGLVATLSVPGGVALDVYQPRHATAFGLG